MYRDLPYDPEFRAALMFFLRERDWTCQEFCERTRLTPESKRRIVPSSVSDWFKRSHPSNRAIMIACEALGVPRSYFYEAGERLVAAEKELNEKQAALREEDSGLEEESSRPEDGPIREGEVVSFPVRAAAAVSG